MSEAEELLARITNERVSDIVYHSTHPKYLASILNQNAFRLTAVPSSDEDEMPHQKGKKFYFLSLSRTAKIPSFGSLPVRIVLDGTKLNSKYSGGPVNYFRRHSKLDQGYFEYEDRIFSDEPWIKDAAKYMKEIHVLEDGSSDSYGTPKDTLHAWYLAKKLGVPFYAYSWGNKNHWERMDKVNAMTPKEFENRYNIRDKDRPSIARQAQKYDAEIIKSLIELLNTPAEYRSRLSHASEVYLQNIQKGTFSGDRIERLIIGYKRNEIIHKLIDAMRKNGMRTGNDVCLGLVKKWYQKEIKQSWEGSA